MTQEPDWLKLETIETRDAGLEVELDARAKPGSDRTYRWRQQAYTGEEESNWVYGSALSSFEGA